MKKSEFEKYKLDQRYRMIFFVSGLAVAFLLALLNSSYAGEAFALIAGLITGNATASK